MGLRNFGAKDRAIFGKVAGGVGFFGGSAIGLLGAAGKLGMSGMAGFNKDLGNIFTDYRGWRRNTLKKLGQNRRGADIIQARETYGPRRSPKAYEHADKYGRQYNRKTGVYGDRKFMARTAGEHLNKGARNIGRTLTSKAFWGLNIGIAAVMSEGDPLDPNTGMAKHVASGAGGWLGWEAGGSLGAAAGLLVGGPIGAAIGYVAGAFLGAEGGMALAEAPWKMSELGHKYGRNSKVRRSTFIDSEGAMTMRQRGIQAIARSQMSAKGAMGQEALMMHG